MTNRDFAVLLNFYCEGDHSERMELSFFTIAHITRIRDQKEISGIAHDIRIIQALKQSINYQKQTTP